MQWLKASRILIKHSFAVPVIGMVGGVLSGCRTTADAIGEPSIIFARGETEGRSYHIQPVAGGQRPSPLAVPRATGNLQTAARASLVAATVGDEVGGSAELRLLPLGANQTGQVLATEWAWDFSLREEGGAIAWVAGRERRQLFVAREPTWKPAVVPLSADVTPSEPRWLDAQRLLVVLRRAGRSELVTLASNAGEPRVVYRASGDAALSDACRVPGSDDVLVVETPDTGGPGRLLRVALIGGEPRVLATGFFLPDAIAVSPNGRYIAAVWSSELSALHRREAALRWIGEAWRGAPAALPGVTSLAWGPDGAQLAVARREDGRRWIEVYSDGATDAKPRRLGFESAACFAPQWWQPHR